MAYITLDIQKLKHNFEFLDLLFAQHEINWSVVTKLLCGNEEYLRALLEFDIKQICDSRVANIKTIKSINPNIEAIFIRPPGRWNFKNVVRYADVSVNTGINTIKMLSQEAQKQNKVHKIIIMVELGELREGVMREDLMAFYADVFRLKNIEVIGIGTNLSCLNGVLPNHDKLMQLCIYEQLIEATFEKKIPYISGGSSVTIPLIFQNQLPSGINHFRVGETLFMGTDAYNHVPLDGMKTDIFSLYAEIIELIEKPLVPTGEMSQNVDGHETTFDPAMIGQTSYRAIVDIGLLDIDTQHLFLVDEDIDIVGASSDMLVIDLKENAKHYVTHDVIEFRLDYMGILRTLSSKYVEKRMKSTSL